MHFLRRYLSVLIAALVPTQFANALLPSTPLGSFGRQSWQTGSGLPQNTITAITQTSDGYLWVGTESGLARFDGYDFFLPADLQRQPIRALWTVNGTLRVQSATARLALENGRFIPFRDVPPLANPPTLPNVRFKPSCFVRESDGAYWLGTSKGLFRYSHGALQAFSSSDPLSSAEILTLFEDSQGNLWIGTADSGLQMLKEQRFATYGTNRIRSVVGGKAGVWLGTDGSGLLHLQNGKLASEPRIPSDIVLSLANGPRGLFAGTPGGLHEVSQHVTLTSADGLPDDFVRSLFIDGDGSIWAGTRRGLAHIVGSSIATYTQSNGLGSDLVGAIARDAQGTLWVATLHGLSRWRGDAFSNYTVADGLSSNIITDLYPDADGSLWIATQGGGLNRRRGQIFTHAGPERGIPDTLYGVTADESGNVWLAAANGIYRVRKSNFESGSVVAGYGTSDGLRIAECSGGGHPAVWKDAAGGIWFATARGAAYLSPEHAALRDHAPAIVIESVLVDDAAQSPSTVTAVAPGHSRLAFQYAGISFNNPQKVRYRYRLDGFDNSWIDGGSRRAAFYTNLGPGDYTFRVRATNGEGQWSDTAAVLSFRVLPRVYQTWWFRLLLACCAGFLVYGLILWRVRRARTEFRAVLNERTRIAREIHDTLAQGFAGISVQLELVSRLLTQAPENARGHLDQARILARSCIDDARRTIWDLRNTDREELPTRLSKLVRDAAQSSGIDIRFQVRGTYRPLPAQTENEIARIAQEAIANAVRHSRARVIDSYLMFDESLVRLTVSDDGCGMKTVASSDGHYGLTGMRERAQSIGAALSILSEEGAGTTVKVEAPIR